MLEAASISCFIIGIIHSYLGERFILIRLFHGDRVPHLFGSDIFTKGTLRFVWHITTIAWWGFGYLLFEIASEQENLTQTVLYTISIVFLFSGIFSFYFTSGRHLSWLVFFTIAGLTCYSAING